MSDILETGNTRRSTGLMAHRSQARWQGALGPSASEPLPQLCRDTHFKGSLGGLTWEPCESCFKRAVGSSGLRLQTAREDPLCFLRLYLKEDWSRTPDCRPTPGHHRLLPGSPGRVSGQPSPTPLGTDGCYYSPPLQAASLRICVL